MSFKKYLSVYVARSPISCLGQWQIVGYSFLTIYLVNLAVTHGIFNLESTCSAKGISENLKYSPSLFSAVFVGLLIPILEEFGFRLLLVPSRMNVLVSLSIIYSLFLTAFFMHVFEENPGSNLTFFGIAFFVIAVKAGFILNFGLNRGKPMVIDFSNLIEAHPRAAYFTSALLFSFLHLVYQWLYRDVCYIFDIGAFLVYLNYGLVFSLIRLKIGIWASMLIHGLLNLILLFIA